MSTFSFYTIYVDTQTSDTVETKCDTYNFIDLSSYRQCSRKRDWACYSSDEDDSDSSGSRNTSFKKKRTSGLVEYAPQAVGKMTPVSSINCHVQKMY